MTYTKNTEILKSLNLTSSEAISVNRATDQIHYYVIRLADMFEVAISLLEIIDLPSNSHVHSLLNVMADLTEEINNELAEINDLAVSLSGGKHSG